MIVDARAAEAAAAAGGDLLTISYPRFSCSVVSCLARASASASEAIQISLATCGWGVRSSWLRVIVTPQMAHNNHGAARAAHTSQTQREDLKYTITITIQDSAKPCDDYKHG
jgi:hypothetical protein